MMFGTINRIREYFLPDFEEIKNVLAVFFLLLTPLIVSHMPFAFSCDMKYVHLCAVENPNAKYCRRACAFIRIAALTHLSNRVSSIFAIKMKGKRKMSVHMNG